VRRRWAVIRLCEAVTTLEIVGGLVVDRIALIADGLLMRLPPRIRARSDARSVN
jgi:hypothetical protein